MLSPLHSIAYRDPQTPVVYLEVPPAQVVLFQAYFELYEGLGLVRTLDMRKNLLCVITTVSLLDDCCRALEEIKLQIAWRPAEIPSPDEQERYLGYFKNASNDS